MIHIILENVKKYNYAVNRVDIYKDETLEKLDGSLFNFKAYF